MILEIFIILISVVIFGLIGYSWNFSYEKKDEYKVMSSGIFSLLGAVFAITMIMIG